jgi:hypothetical protein
MKYRNLIELAEAFKKGELTGFVLMLDNDDSFLRYIGPVPQGVSDVEAETFRDRKTDEADNIFRGHGYSDLEDACKAAGIPSEWV